MSASNVKWRWVLFALSGLAFAGWALLSMAPLTNGTLLRPGSAMAPRFVAGLLVCVSVAVLARAIGGSAVASPRKLRWPWRLALVVPLTAVILMENVVVLAPDAPGAALVAAWLAKLTLAFGPGEFLVVLLLHWLLAIVVGIIAVGEGGLTGLASLLIGALIGLSGIHPGSGEERLAELDMLLEAFPYWIEVGVVVLLVACRVNPLPAIVAWASASAAEELFRRLQLLTRGNLAEAIPARPIIASVLLITVTIALLMAWYRWPWRRPQPPARYDSA